MARSARLREAPLAMPERRNESAGSDDDRIDDASPAYRRALWIVVGLNGGMAVVGGLVAVFARTVSVQADALDFLGDALATGIGLVLIGRSPLVRANAALWQGLALGALGALTLGSALWRAFVAGVPEALSMGAYGLTGLAVNVTCALLLMRHKGHDATDKAVWLYSRNDAIGNVAVIVAAGVVAVTATKWADLAVAAVMAGLFLQSSVLIIRQARGELRSAKA